MGACASVPKVIKADAVAAPLPEQPKEEETTTTTAPEVTTVDKQLNGEDGEKKVEDEKLAGDIGSLLIESEAAKESLVQDEKSLETIDGKPEEAKVSDETDAKQPAAAEEKSV